MSEIKIRIDAAPNPIKQVLELLEAITSHGPIGMDGNDPYKECAKCRRNINRAIGLLKKELKKK